MLKDSEGTRLVIIEAALLVAPFVAFAGSRLIRGIHSRTIPSVCAIFICIAGIGLFLNNSAYSWRNGGVNTFLGSAGYLAAVALMFFLIAQVKFSWARWILRAVVSVPVFIGLTLGTVGILGLMFIVGDQTPRSVRQLTPKYALEIRYQGNAVADTDYNDATVVRYLPFVPLKKTVWHKAYDHRHYVILDDPDVIVAPDLLSATVSMERLAGGAETNTVALP